MTQTENPRDRWHPLMAHFFGVHPWMLDNYTPTELKALESALKALMTK